MLRAIRACASLLLLEDKHSQGWRPVVCAGLPGGFHSGGLCFSDTAPLLFSLYRRLILAGPSEEFLMQARKKRVRVLVKPTGEGYVLSR